VEAVTGRVPFSADTTIGMLTARTQRPLTAPQELGSLAPVIDRAGRLEPDDRYPDAGTMRQALADVGDTLPPPGPLVLAGMVDHTDPHPTRVALPTAPPLFDQDAADRPEQPTAPTPAVKAARATAGASKPTGRRRLVPWVVAVVILVAVALAAVAFAQMGGASANPTPGFVGFTEEAASALASNHNISVHVTPVASPDPAGIVVGQSPDSGAWTSSGTVDLRVSTGPAKVLVPSVKGQPWPGVQSQLDATGFFYKVQHTFSDQYAKGDVVTITPPPGTRIAPDAAITVLLSDGHAPVNVPNVIGMSYSDAVNALTAVNLKSQRIKDVFSNDVPRGMVASTIPPVGSAAPFQSTVQIQVSRGPIMATVPDLIGLTVAEATAKLSDVGLPWDSNGRIRPGDVVTAQDPKALARVPLETTTVNLTFDRPHGH
jgi:serine/threonine-protein kinase